MEPLEEFQSPEAIDLGNIEEILSDVEEIILEKNPTEDSNINYIHFLKVSTLENYLRNHINLQSLWIISHSLTLIGTLLYVVGLLKDNMKLSTQAYTIATSSSLFTYLVVLQRSALNEEVQFDSRQVKVVLKKKPLNLTDSLKNENAHLLGYILLWNFTNHSLLKLIPFFIYSFLNMISFFILEIFPENALSIAISPLLNYVEVPLLIIASYIDLFVFGIITDESLKDSNFYPLIIYSFIWLLRFENSEASRSSIGLIVKFLDNYLANSELISETTRESWKDFRDHFQNYFPLENKEFKDAESLLFDSYSTLTN